MHGSNHTKSSSGLLAGRLEGISLPELTWSLCQQGKTGVLKVHRPTVTRRLYLDSGRIVFVASSDPKEVSRLEGEISDGNGLLAANGASRGNLFSGDAPYVMNTASTITDLSRFHTISFYAFFLQPYNFARTLLLTIWDVVLEKYQFWQARRNDVQPRLDPPRRPPVRLVHQPTPSRLCVAVLAQLLLIRHSRAHRIRYRTASTGF